MMFTDTDSRQWKSIIIRDITRRNEARDEIKKLNRIYSLLSWIDKSIVHIKDRQRLFEETCRIAVETGEFRMCWIGTIKEDESVIPAASYDFTEGYLDNFIIPLDCKKEKAHGPTGTAARLGMYTVCNDIEKDKIMLPWKEEALKRGYHSVASFPLFSADKIYGAINFYSSHPGFFNKEEIRLLEELSSDISYSIDSIEREKQRQIIEKERDRFFNHPIDMMAIAGLDGYFRQLNPAWEKTLSWTADEMLGRPYAEFIHPDDRESVNKRINELKSREQPGNNFLCRHLCKDGSYKWLSRNSVPLLDEGLIFSVTRDVTASVRNENDRKNLEAQLIQAQKLESLGTMAGGIAHDFNNILNIIMGYASILREMVPVDKSRDSIDAILSASSRGAGLVKQLLTFARKSETVLQPVRINDMIKDIKKLLGQTFPKTIEISLNLKENLPFIIADPTQMHQVLLNLCVNARDAMQSGGRLSISTEAIQGAEVKTQAEAGEDEIFVKIQVSDTGSGMTDTVKQRIFEPFFTTKETGKGTGLGLSLVYAIIKNHGGIINVSTEKGKGSIFSICLPAQEQTSEIFQPGKEMPAAALRGSGTVLLVEDEQLYNELLTTLLVLKGYKVITAYDGLQGIMSYQSNISKINIVVLDVGLPRLRGDEVYKQIKSINPRAKIILMSGFIDPELRAKFLDMGIKHILQKPFLPDKLVQIINDFLIEE